MARRRKKSRVAVDQQKAGLTNSQLPMLLHKSLPSLPQSAAPSDATPTNAIPSSAFAEHETTLIDSHPDVAPERSPRPRPPNPRNESARNIRRDRSPATTEDYRNDMLLLPASTYKNNRHSTISQKSDLSGSGEDFFIPLALDTNTLAGPLPLASERNAGSGPPEEEPMKPKITETNANPRDYFNTSRDPSSSRQRLHEKPPLPSETSIRNIDSNDSKLNIGSPHIAYQEKGRKPSSELTDTIRKRKEPLVTSTPGSTVASPGLGTEPSRTQQLISPPAAVNGMAGPGQNERFKLQEVPKGKKSGGSARSSRSEASSPSIGGPPLATLPRSISESSSTNSVIQMKEQTITIPPKAPQRPIPSGVETNGSPHTSETVDFSPDSAHSASSAIQAQLLQKPKRGDSLGPNQSKQSILRKEVASGSPSKPSIRSPKMNGDQEDSSSSSSATTTPVSPMSHTQLNGGMTISGPVDSPKSIANGETPQIPSRAQGRSVVPGSDSFTAPRAPPQPPIEQHKSTNHAINGKATENGVRGGSPNPSALPRYSAGGEFSMDEDMARILGGEESENPASFLRRVSHSVRHGRSYSDKGTRSLSNSHKWPKSPLNETMAAGYPQEISSPLSASPETKEEYLWLRNQLRRVEHKNVEQERTIAELKARLDGTADIKQVNTELREKRSTMVILDTQKEIVIRELEVLTDHIAAAKNSNEPFDLNKVMSETLSDFAIALQKLKDSFTGQIEELIQQRNQLVDEIADLTQVKDKGFQEFEQITLKNAQLAEFNNELVHNIQGLYKANREPIAGQPFDNPRPSPSGLGIYTNHHKDRSDATMDGRDLRSAGNDGSVFGPHSHMQRDYDAEPATVLTTPQVVNIRKGQPKKSMWKKGGQTVAKGVSKGFKGAFSSNAQNSQNQYQREDQMPEGTPYGMLPSDTSSSSLQRAAIDPSRQQGQSPFAFFGGTQKHPTRAMQQKSQSNSNMSNLQANNGSGGCLLITNRPDLLLTIILVLFGSELEQRADHEKRDIPSVVIRCIEEVEARGMDIEGIYRKSGGAGQVKIIQEGFEGSNEYDISDPDLDINAVTSALKQYFRKLPIPLVTYDVYDRILESNGTHLRYLKTCFEHLLTKLDVPDVDARAGALNSAIQQLPPRHRDCFEFLIFHLARVALREKENLMTPLNLAVVFAPTIMRPQSLEREMNDMHMKNQAIQFLIENYKSIFTGPNSGDI
ncbi:MAG: Rho-type gtpase-activating protein [Pycnora praestabilis]|nr:MAG: Rho-type gtpase-activating protein [Pycnora praestabilis]